MALNRRDARRAVRAVRDVLAEEYGGDYERVTIKEVFEPTRRQAVVGVRHTTWWALRQTVDVTMEELGRLFHRDHSTVSYGVRDAFKLEDAYQAVKGVFDADV